ncbi:MAG TPA: hypothetical protein VK427_05180, partial [Kofleriaceae bacterium]|nr:hypothetical protein [Kofleriaceae bacterium]
MRLVTVAAIVGVGCASEGDSMQDTRCVVTVVEDGQETERSEAEFGAPGQAAQVTLFQRGRETVRWTYGYDSAGRLLTWDRAFDGGPVSAHVRYTHMLTAVREVYAGEEVVDLELDAADRITRRTMVDLDERFELTSDGAIHRAAAEGVDVDTREPYTSTQTHKYVAGRLVERVPTDSRLPGGGGERYAYERTGDQLVVTSGARSWRYTYDRKDRLVRADDGALVAMLAYTGDALTVTISRDGNAVRTYSYSALCRYAPTAPLAPASGTRPNAPWTTSTPPIPSPY